MEDKKPVIIPPKTEQTVRGTPGVAQEQARSESFSDEIARLREAMEGDVLPDVNKNPNRDPDMWYFYASTTSKTDPIHRRLQMGYTFVKAEEFPDLSNDYRITSEGNYHGLIGVNELVLMKIPRRLAEEIMKINHYERPLAEEGRIQSEAVRKEYRDRYGKELGGYAREDEGFRDLGKGLKSKPKSYLPG